MDPEKIDRIRHEIKKTIKESNLLMDNEPQHSGKPEHFFKPDAEEKEDQNDKRDQ